MKEILDHEVLRIFEEISAIPRESGNEKAISDWIRSWSEERGLSVIQDKLHDLTIFKPASPGYEDHPPVLLQAFYCLRILRSILLTRKLKRLLRSLAVRSHVNLSKRALYLWLHGLRQFGQHVGRLMHLASLMPRPRIMSGQRLPETQGNSIYFSTQSS